MKAAVIGIGSNSVRCLLAETGDGAFDRIWRGREGTRLFAGLDGQGNLNPESMEKTVAAVAWMAREARERGAESLSVFATSAARDARTGAAFAEAVRQLDRRFRRGAGKTLRRDRYRRRLHGNRRGIAGRH